LTGASLFKLKILSSKQMKSSLLHLIVFASGLSATRIHLYFTIHLIALPPFILTFLHLKVLHRASMMAPVTQHKVGLACARVAFHTPVPTMARSISSLVFSPDLGLESSVHLPILEGRKRTP
jgi:hypothetical protein